MNYLICTFLYGCEMFVKSSSKNFTQSLFFSFLQIVLSCFSMNRFTALVRRTVFNTSYFTSVKTLHKLRNSPTTPVDNVTILIHFPSLATQSLRVGQGAQKGLVFHQRQVTPWNLLRHDISFWKLITLHQ